MADLACGLGWSSIAIARAYPLVTVEGFDLDAAAIASAVDTAAAEGLADRLSFTVADAADPGLSGRFDLVTILEGFHDMARPVEALRAVPAILANVPENSHDGCRRGDLHTTVWFSCSTRFPLTIKPPTAWRCAGRSGMDMVISVPGDVERTSNCPPDASTLARIDAIPI